MAGYTDNLGLYKKDPVADGADTFNIQTMMNDNWDKLDGMFDLGFTTGTIPAAYSFFDDVYDWNFAYGNGVWVGVSGSSDAAVWSADGGQTWNTATMPESASWNGVVYGNGKFVACNSGGETCKLAWSADGQTWTACNGTGSDLVNGLSICCGNGRFVVVGGNGSVIYADDPTGEWSFTGVVFSSSESRSVAYGNGVFVSTSETAARAQYSTNNGANWSVTNAKITGSGGAVSVAYGNGVFAAVASGSSKASWSADGINWTAVDLPAAANNQWSFIVFGSGRFIAGSPGDQVLAISRDGRTWTALTAPVTGNWRRGGYGKGTFLLGQSGSATTLLIGSTLYQLLLGYAEPDLMKLLDR